MRPLWFIPALPIAAASLFFAWYSIRLAYVWTHITVPAASGMYIGAFAFPTAVIVFGAMAWYCVRRAR